MRFCGYCGAELKDDDSFCGACGKKVEEKGESENIKKLESEKKSSGNKKTVILLVCIVSAALIAAGLFFFSQNKNKKEPEKQSVKNNETVVKKKEIEPPTVYIDRMFYTENPNDPFGVGCLNVTYLGIDEATEKNYPSLKEGIEKFNNNSFEYHEMVLDGCCECIMPCYIGDDFINVCQTIGGYNSEYYTIFHVINCKSGDYVKLGDITENFDGFKATVIEAYKNAMGQDNEDAEAFIEAMNEKLTEDTYIDNRHVSIGLKEDNFCFCFYDSSLPRPKNAYAFPIEFVKIPYADIGQYLKKKYLPKEEVKEVECNIYCFGDALNTDKSNYEEYIDGNFESIRSCKINDTYHFVKGKYGWTAPEWNGHNSVEHESEIEYPIYVKKLYKRKKGH